MPGRQLLSWGRLAYRLPNAPSTPGIRDTQVTRMERSIQAGASPRMVPVEEANRSTSNPIL